MTYVVTVTAEFDCKDKVNLWVRQFVRVVASPQGAHGDDGARAPTEQRVRQPGSESDRVWGAVSKHSIDNYSLSLSIYLSIYLYL